MEIEMISADVIIVALLSIAAEWLPGFREWWAALVPARKAQLMALMVAVVTFGMAVFRCYAYDNVCPDWRTFVTNLVATFFLALAANQGVHNVNRTIKAGRS